MAEWVKKKSHLPLPPLSLCCLQEISDIRKQSERTERILHTNGNQKKAGINFKTKAVIRDKDGHYIMINGYIQQEEETFMYPI